MSLSNFKKVICAEELLEDSSVCEGIRCENCSMLSKDVSGKPYCRIIKWVNEKKGMYISVEVDDVDKS